MRASSYFSAWTWSLLVLVWTAMLFSHVGPQVVGGMVMLTALAVTAGFLTKR